VLVLGSLPGEASLAAGQYYAHPRNQFWPLIATVIDAPGLPSLDYHARLDLLKTRGVALWDTVASARREGSLDAAIRDAADADLAGLVDTLPLLRAVAFNGAKSAAIGRAALAGRDLTLIALPSSSPAQAALSFEGKREAWLAMREFLAPAPLPFALAADIQNP
jgi:hypoxanthine-DNA glycosylase